MYSEGPWLMKKSVNLCGTTFIYVVLNPKIMDPIPHLEQFSYFLLTTYV